MPNYNPDQEHLSRGLCAVLKLSLFSALVGPWACPLYCLSVPSTPILMNTVVQPYLGQFFDKSAVETVKLVILVFDVIFILLVNYMAFCIVLYYVTTAIIYIGNLLHMIDLTNFKNRVKK